MEWPAALGVYGAIVATLTAGWTIWVGLQDRGCLKLALQLRRYESNAIGERIEKPPDRLDGIELHISVVNTGRRSLTVVSWYCIPHSRSAEHILLSQYPRQVLLSETEQASLVCRDVAALAGGFRRMYVVDSSNRRWYVRRRHLRTITKDIKALRSADSRPQQTAP